MTIDWAVSGWGRPGSALTVGSGRQGLGLLARWCRSTGISTVLAPAFCCTTMITPFWLEGMSVRFVAVDERLVMDADSLRTARAGHDGPVAVLVARTGGSGPSPRLRAELAATRRDGGLVIDDATHAILADTASGARPSWCDASLASLRKLLPVADGALVHVRDGIGLESDLAVPGQNPPGEVLALRGDLPVLARGEPQRPFPSGAGRYLDALARAEAHFDESLSPTAPSTVTRRVLGDLDGDALARRTAQNARVLAGALSGSGARMINPGVPGPLLLRTTRAPAIDAELAAHGIFSPMDWTRPGAVDAALWPGDVLALDTRPIAGLDDAAMHDWLRFTAEIIRKWD